MVYELALVHNEHISFGNTGALPADSPAKNPEPTRHLKTLLPLTQVSRQLRDETTPILFARNTFRVLLSTRIHAGPLTQFKRMLRSAKPELFDLFSITFRPGCLTYGDHKAAAWARVARKEALMHIRRLAVDIEQADSVPRWRYMQYLYQIPPEPATGRFFSPQEWSLHAVRLECRIFECATWIVDFETRRVRCASVRKCSEGWNRRKRSPCQACKRMLREWGSDQTVRGDFLTKEHFLRLVGYDS